MLLRSNDYIFYPLMLVAAGLMIGLPLYLAGADRIGVADDIRENGILIDGERLQTLAAGEGVSTSLMRDVDNRLFARVVASSPRGAPNLTPSAGVFDALRPYELDAIAGQDLRVTYTLRASDDAGAQSTDLGFFEDGLGQSYWRPHTLNPGISDYAITVDAPYCDITFGFAGVWPGYADGANSVDLYAIRIEVTGEADCTEQAG